MILLAASAAAEPVGTHHAPECAVSLERRDQAHGPTVLRLRPACPLGLESSRQAVAALLAHAPAGAQELSVFLGRAIEYPWLSSLLARRAASSSAWDRNAGRAVRGTDNGAVADLVRGAPELVQLFAGWTVAGVSVEKVLVRPARELALPFGDAVPPAARLPYDAMVWVRLRR